MKNDNIFVFMVKFFLFLADPFIYIIGQAFESFWEGFYTDNKVAYTFFIIVFILTAVNSCHG